MAHSGSLDRVQASHRPLAFAVSMAAWPVGPIRPLAIDCAARSRVRLGPHLLLARGDQLHRSCVVQLVPAGAHSRVLDCIEPTITTRFSPASPVSGKSAIVGVEPPRQHRSRVKPASSLEQRKCDVDENHRIQDFTCASHSIWHCPAHRPHQFRPSQVTGVPLVVSHLPQRARQVGPRLGDWHMCFNVAHCRLGKHPTQRTDSLSAIDSYTAATHASSASTTGIVSNSK